MSKLQARASRPCESCNQHTGETPVPLPTERQAPEVRRCRSADLSPPCAMGASGRGGINSALRRPRWALKGMSRPRCPATKMWDTFSPGERVGKSNPRQDGTPTRNRLRGWEGRDAAADELQELLAWHGQIRVA